MLHVDVAKVDLDIALLHLLYVFYLDIASSMTNLNVPCNIKWILHAVDFFLIINGWLTTFQYSF